MMADNIATNIEIPVQAVASRESIISTLNVSEDLASPSKLPSYYTIIRQLDDLKTKNTFNLNDLEILQDEVNHHLIKSQDHYRQVIQLQLAYGAGLSRIKTRPDGSIDPLNARKLDLATMVLKFDIKSTKSLGASYSAQKKFFKFIEEFKRVELEMQELLRGAIEQGEAHEDFYVELEESEARMIVIEASRVTRKEGWLEWMDELL
jgi:hypothetical protein